MDNNVIKNLKKGGITKKTIKGKNGKNYIYYMFQWRENGKQKSRIIKEEDIPYIKSQLEKNENIQNGMDDLNKSILANPNNYNFSSNVILGDELLKLVVSVKKYKKRSCYNLLKSYIKREYADNKVFILYGLRRTGKTTLIRQCIYDLSETEFQKTAFIQITSSDSFAKLNKDLIKLKENGFENVFIDEITLMSDFIDGAALLTDIYVSSGMKIVLSGTDSLGFLISKSNELFDRCVLLHTTFISYKEFSNVLNIDGVDDYIRYGGTMSIEGNHYNEGMFNSKSKTDEYVDSAIANNIQHSLRCYQDGSHFRRLYSLYENNELTNAINRVVEDMNHRFTIEVIEKEFKSNDLRLSAKNLRKDKTNATTILDDIDIEMFTKRLKDLLQIKNKKEQISLLDDVCMIEIKEYLQKLDLITEIDIEDIDDFEKINTRTVFSQPGLRYSQAKSFIESLSKDRLFMELSFENRKFVIERILSEIKGRMLEDIVLLETQQAKKDLSVSKLLFSDGEFDMIVYDSLNGGCDIYEIKHSEQIVEKQARFLKDEEKCKRTEYRYGKINNKIVLYRGETKSIGEIKYINVEEYLKAL